MKNVIEKTAVRRRSRLTLALCAALIVVSTGVPRCQSADLYVDDVMMLDPQLDLPKWRKVFSSHLKPLWLRALQQPDAEVRRLAADTVSIAVERGMSGLDDMADALTAILTSDGDPLIRRSAAKALVAIEARQAAPLLLDWAARDGLLMAQITEPALGRWSEPGIMDRWLERLHERTAQRGLLLLAIDGVGLASEPLAREPLLVIVRDRETPSELRLAAAHALGQLAVTGLESEALACASRTEQPEFLGRLLAVNLLQRQYDAASAELLSKLASDREPAVAAVALGRLREIDFRVALSIAESSLESSDARLRRVTAEVLAEGGSPKALAGLGRLLGDRNPGVRRYAAGRLAEFGKRPDRRDEVLGLASQALARDDWRSLEQASLVLGTLDYKPVASRLLELLNYPRAEVAVTAAWALRKINVPDTLPEILKISTLLQTTIDSPRAHPHSSFQLAQHLQHFGVARYQESLPLLGLFVPQSISNPQVRAAAIWSLGQILENQPEHEMAQSLGERLADLPPPPPGEILTVREMAAISIGRMKAESQLPVLRHFMAQNGPTSRLGLALRWAIEQITGEEWQPSPPVEFGVSGWFLRPIEESRIRE